ncbi:hypothetical protein QYM36_017743, partial [Artemia franciscana]
MFSSVKYCCTGSIPSNIEKALIDGGAKKPSSISGLMTHLIAGENPDPTDIEETLDLYNKPVVTPKWVLHSVYSQKLLPVEVFRHEQGLFSKFKFCLLNSPIEDVRNLWAMIAYHGGRSCFQLTDDVTHVIVTSTEDVLYGKVTGMDREIKVITPDWIVDCVSSRKLHNEKDYSPALLIQPPRKETIPPKEPTPPPYSVKEHPTLSQVLKESLPESHHVKEPVPQPHHARETIPPSQMLVNQEPNQVDMQKQIEKLGIEQNPRIEMQSLSQQGIQKQQMQQKDVIRSEQKPVAQPLAGTEQVRQQQQQPVQLAQNVQQVPQEKQLTPQQYHLQQIQLAVQQHLSLLTNSPISNEQKATMTQKFQLCKDTNELQLCIITVRKLLVEHNVLPASVLQDPRVLLQLPPQMGQTRPGAPLQRLSLQQQQPRQQAQRPGLLQQQLQGQIPVVRQNLGHPRMIHNVTRQPIPAIPRNNQESSIQQRLEVPQQQPTPQQSQQNVINTALDIPPNRPQNLNNFTKELQSVRVQPQSQTIQQFQRGQPQSAPSHQVQAAQLQLQQALVNVQKANQQITSQSQQVVTSQQSVQFQQQQLILKQQQAGQTQQAQSITFTQQVRQSQPRSQAPQVQSRQAPQEGRKHPISQMRMPSNLPPHLQQVIRGQSPSNNQISRGVVQQQWRLQPPQVQQNWQQQSQQSSAQSSSNLLEQRQGPNTVAQQSASVGQAPQRQQQIPTIEEQQAIQYYISKLSPEQFKQLNTSVLQRLDDTTRKQLQEMQQHAKSLFIQRILLQDPGFKAKMHVIIQQMQQQKTPQASTSEVSQGDGKPIGPQPTVAQIRQPGSAGQVPLARIVHGQIVLPPGTNLTEQQKQALIQQQLQIQQQQAAARAGAQGQQFQGLQAQNQGNAQNQGQQQQNAAPVSTQIPATGAPSQFSQQVQRMSIPQQILRQVVNNQENQVIRVSLPQQQQQPSVVQQKVVQQVQLPLNTHQNVTQQHVQIQQQQVQNQQQLVQNQPQQLQNQQQQVQNQQQQAQNQQQQAQNQQQQ